MMWWRWQMCMKFQKNDRVLLCVLNKCIKLVWTVVVFSVHWELYTFISQLWCNHTWSFIRNTKYVQKSAHNQTGTPPPDVIRDPHLLPGIGLFFGIPAFFSRTPHSAAPRISDAQMESLRQFWDAQKLIKAALLVCLETRLSSRIRSLLAFVDRSGGCVKGWRCLWSL